MFLFVRSLAYNNLETLPKDIFKGMDALTKVYVFYHSSPSFLQHSILEKKVI